MVFPSPGLLPAEDGRAWRMSRRAEEQWKLARKKGIPWREFEPKARHYFGKKDRTNIVSGEIGFMPLDVICPVCGTKNRLSKPSLLP